jgi:hypothetical protein
MPPKTRILPDTLPIFLVVFFIFFVAEKEHGFGGFQNEFYGFFYFLISKNLFYLFLKSVKSTFFFEKLVKRKRSTDLADFKTDFMDFFTF